MLNLWSTFIGFHNIISTIDDLEQKLGPEKHEDLRFLRDILQNDRLSALHHVRYYPKPTYFTTVDDSDDTPLITDKQTKWRQTT